MDALTAFLAAISAALFVGLVLVLAWALTRERYYENQLHAKEDQFAEALKREGQLTAKLQQLVDDKTRANLRIQRMEQRYISRGELIRDLGLNPEHLEQSRESLYGMLAITRVRIGILLAAELNRIALRDVAVAAGGRTENVYQQLNKRLADGDVGYQHDQHARHLLREMLDVDRLESPLKENVNEEMVG